LEPSNDWPAAIYRNQNDSNIFNFQHIFSITQQNQGNNNPAYNKQHVPTLSELCEGHKENQLKMYYKLLRDRSERPNINLS